MALVEELRHVQVQAILKKQRQRIEQQDQDYDRVKKQIIKK